jgi:hypothetical protein
MGRDCITSLTEAVSGDPPARVKPGHELLHGVHDPVRADRLEWLGIRSRFELAFTLPVTAIG